MTLKLLKLLNIMLLDVRMIKELVINFLILASIGDVVLIHGGHNSRTIIFTETKTECNDIMLHAKIKGEC